MWGLYPPLLCSLTSSFIYLLQVAHGYQALVQVQAEVGVGLQRLLSSVEEANVHKNLRHGGEKKGLGGDRSFQVLHS